jgi:hypothetical protein
MRRDELPKPLTEAERRHAEWDKELANANELLSRGGGVPLEVLEKAMLRKLTIEGVRAAGKRRAEESAAEAQRKQNEFQEKKRVHEHRIETEPAYRREVERRARLDEFDRKLGKAPGAHGPLPRPQ